MKLAVTLNDVSYSSGSLLGLRKKKILNQINLSVGEGEVLGIIGKNGSGKSSLLQVIAGVLRPDVGTMETGTQSVSLMTLNLGVDPVLSGRENAILQGMLLGVGYKKIIGALPKIKDLSGLGSQFEEPFYTYSSGMMARLGFVVNDILDTDVLLIDEIIGIGDEQFRLYVEESFSEKKKSGKTMIIVSHNLQMIEVLCDRAALVDRGQIVAIGNPSETIQAYLSL